MRDLGSDHYSRQVLDHFESSFSFNFVSSLVRCKADPQNAVASLQ